MKKREKSAADIYNAATYAKGYEAQAVAARIPIMGDMMGYRAGRDIAEMDAQNQADGMACGQAFLQWQKQHGY